MIVHIHVQPLWSKLVFLKLTWIGELSIDFNSQVASWSLFECLPILVRHIAATVSFYLTSVQTTIRAKIPWRMLKNGAADSLDLDILWLQYPTEKYRVTSNNLSAVPLVLDWNLPRIKLYWMKSFTPICLVHGFESMDNNKMINYFH